MDEGAEQAPKDESIKQAKAAVSKLYEFNAHYFEHHEVEQASRKSKDVQQLMNETISTLESLQSLLPKVDYWFLRGRTLNIQPDYCAEAEQCLSKAIKHDPSLVEAWCALGECYWKAGNIQQAHDCFTGSLSHMKNKESLRNLSMVLRQMGKDAKEREANVKESVDKAKEAVGLDVKDGISWMVLGNAYLSLYFMMNRDAKMLKQCVSAYAQAEKDPVAANNPDLHFNKATLYQYQEDYKSMLHELSLASSLDPVWSAPIEKSEAVWSFLKSMAHLITTKGKVKPKVLAGLVSSVAQSDKFLGPYADKKKLANLSQLNEDATNTDSVIVVAVAAIVHSKDRVPYACVVVDSLSTCVGLTIYNLDISTNFSVGDIITIPDPLFKYMKIQNKEESVELKSICVMNPSQLLVNGQKLASDKLAPSTVSITAFS